MLAFHKNSTLAAYITTRCNFACPHCLRRIFDKNKSSIEDLSVEVFEKILKKAGKFGFSSISFTGGEPILHPQFSKFLDSCGKYDYNFTIVSNGSFFEEYWSCIKNHLSRLSFISLSLDGSSADIHNKQRNNPGSFENVIKAIEFYQKKRVNCLGIVTCLSEYNKKDIPALIQLCQKLKVKNLKFLQPNLVKEGDGYYLSIIASQELLRQIKEISYSFRNDMKINIGTHQHLIKTDKANFCGVLDDPHFSIDPEGGINFCCDLYCFPDLRPHILKDGFEKSIFLNLAIINKLKEQRILDFEKNKFSLPSEFYNCEYCNNHIGNTISQVRQSLNY